MNAILILGGFKNLIDLTLSQHLLATFDKMRRAVLYGFVLSFWALWSGQVVGQTNVLTVDFETINSGYSTTDAYGSGFTDLFNRTNSNLPNCTNEDGFFWGFEDMTNGNKVINLDQINITGASEFVFSIDMVAHHYNDWDNNDAFEIDYSIDGGIFNPLMHVRNNGGTFNQLPSLDTDFDGVGDCGAGTLPALTTGTSGCSTSSSNFATFSTTITGLSGNTTLDIRLTAIECTATDEGMYFDNIEIDTVVTPSGPSCSITNIGLTNVQCDDNGTPGNSADDFITFDLNPTGSNLGTDYTVSVNTSSITSSITGTYGGTSSFTMATGSAGGGNVTVTITDDTDGSCTANDLLTDPGSCSVAPCTEPAQPTALTFTNVTDTQIDGSFTGSGADEYLVVRHTASSLSANPSDATTYAPGDPLGGGEVIQSSSATTFSATSLTASTQYYFFVFGYNNTACSGGPNYNITAPLSDDTTTTAAPAESQCQFDDFNSGYGNWTGGSGTYQNSSAGLTGNGTGFNTTNDNIITGSALTDPVRIEFQLARTPSSANRTLSIEYSTNPTGPWTTAQDITVGSVTTSHQLFTVNLNLTGDYYIQIIMSQRSGGSYLLDDVEVICSDAADPPCNEPVAQPTALVFDDVTDSQIGGDFTGVADTTSYLVVRSTSSTLSGNPVDATTYSVGDALGGGTVVQASADTFFTATGLNASTQYYFFIFAYNDVGCTGGPDYFTTSPLSDNETTAAAPNICGEEDFTNVPGGGYATVKNWTGLNSVDWTAVRALNTESITGNGSVAVTLEDGIGILSNDVSISGGMGILTMTTERAFSGGSGDLDIYVNSVFRGTIPYSGSAQTSSITINISGNIDLEIQNNSSDRVIIDDLEWECYTGCTSSHTVTSFFPSSGPVGSRITILGTDFTGSTTVTVGGSSATVISQNDSVLYVQVPSAASSGPIVVTESACDVTTTNFEVISDVGDCLSGGGANYTNLFISEVYDADSGNGFYIELYNPTASSIDLGNLDYEIDRYADISNTSPSDEIDLTGTVAAFSTFTINLHSDNPCGSVTADLNTASNFGINENDRITLTKAGIDEDEVETPNEKGYTISRLTTAAAPSATYDAADWSTNSSESCTDLGTAPVSSVTPPSVTVQPSDVNSCTFDFTLTAADANGGALTYQWFFNDSVSSGWLEVNGTNISGLTISGETSNNLTITSNTSSVATLSGYQFYCEITEDATCGIASEAVLFEVGGEPYFRSAGTGDWDDLSSWEISDAAAGPTWIAACELPTPANSDSIRIQSGDEITLGVDLSADQILIEDGGSLIINSSAELTIPDGNASGPDLRIEGTLEDNGSAANGLNFEGSASWEMTSTGVIIKTAASSINEYRDNYEGGMSNIPADADWVYLYTGSNVSLSAVDMFYPNLHFESNAGSYSGNTFSTSFTGGSGGFATVKGDLNIGLGLISGGTDSYEVFNNNINTTPMLVEGDLNIAAGSRFTNDSYDGGSSSSRGDGTGINVQGNVDVDGTLDFNHAAGVLEFSGNSRQTLSGSGSIETAQTLVNNGADIELNGIDLETNSIQFIDGKIITDVTTADMVWVKGTNTNAITNSTASNGTDEYIEGKLQWTTDGSSTYTFPIGDATYGAQGFDIDLTGSSGSTILAYTEPRTNAVEPNITAAWCDLEVKNSATAVNVGQGAAGFDGILDVVQFDFPNNTSPIQWDITNPSGGISAYDLTVLASGAPAVPGVAISANGVAARYLMKDGDPGENVPDTIAQTTPSYTGNGYFLCPNGYTLTGLTSFSKFAVIGASQPNSFLPIELKYFRGRAESVGNLLEWETASETNNDFFSLERLSPYGDFQTIAEINGAGNSNVPLSYFFRDINLIDFGHYYRLKQTDFDGQFTYSDTIFIASRGKEKNRHNFYWDMPNQELVIEASGEYRELTIYDLQGRMIRQFPLASETQHYFALPNLSGLFIVEVRSPFESVRKKILVNP